MNDKKLFALRISDLDNAAEISKKWATHTVSILDSDLTRETLCINDSFHKKFYENLIPKQTNGVLLYRCYFDDVIPKDDFGLIVATLEDIQNVLNFTEKLTPDAKLLIHCGAGISRSCAVAVGVLCQHGLTPAEALEKVFLVRKGAYPNAHIISLMDKALGLKNTLENALKLALPMQIKG